MRKLASIRKISEIRPIEGADQIVCAIIDGWEVVTQKSNNFEVGDLVVYFEIDSVLPEQEPFEFLRERCYVPEKSSINGAGFRLKTIRLRGQISQGLILPLERKFGGWVLNYEPKGIQQVVAEGDDVTDLLDVVKFERPLPTNLGGTAKGNFPPFIPKTDQDRIQNVFKHLKNKWLDHEWEVTTKLDGSSFTAYYRTDPNIDGGEFGVCSRNLDLERSDSNAFWQAAIRWNLENRMRNLGRSLAIQGELMGPGIQGNKENLSHLNIYVFDIWDIDNQCYLDALERYDITYELDLLHVPVKHTGFAFLEDVTVKDIIDLADGPSLNAKLREGLVFKSRNDPSISFKAISNKWLLSTGE